MKRLLCALCASVFVSSSLHADLRIGTFNIDATPPVGSSLAYTKMSALDKDGPLSCRGVVILSSSQKPIVLCGIDWIGIGNEAYDAFRQAIAKGAGTDANRVAFHVLHQHEAPRCDFTAENILAKHGLGGEMFDVKFSHAMIEQTSKAVSGAAASAKPLTHVATGQAKIEKVASNRRILGSDGKVKFVRYTATRDPKIRAFPAGVIDPYVKLIGLFSGDKPVAVLTYYATHPQSYYRNGLATPDFPGIARNLRDAALPGVLHVHFTGAGGNIGAGKWNDGAMSNRMVLAKRVEAGMKAAWDEALKARRAVSEKDVAWSVQSVALPATDALKRETLEKNIANAKAHRSQRIRSAVHIAWLDRCAAGHKIDIGCLKIANARVLQMPGELFVEYQLAAQKMRPDLFVAVAAYGEYAPGYIGTEIAYGQGGYETSPISSRVAPSVEKVLMDAMRKLLEVPASK